MNKIIFTGLTFLCAAGTVLSQPNKYNNEKRERIHAMKIAYLTDHLDLTPEEAQRFWPVYNEFEQKRHELERSMAEPEEGKRPDILAMSDEDIEKFIIQRLKEEQQIVELKKEYYEKLKKVISVRKVFLLFEAESGFKRMLLERLKEGPPPGHEPGRGR